MNLRRYRDSAWRQTEISLLNGSGFREIIALLDNPPALNDVAAMSDLQCCTRILFDQQNCNALPIEILDDLENPGCNQRGETQ
jgi:hypothetical protein